MPQAALEQLCYIGAGLSTQDEQIKAATIRIDGLGDRIPAVDVVLNNFVIIHFDVGPHADDDDNFRAIFGALMKSFLCAPPKLLAFYMQMLVVGIQSCTSGKWLCFLRSVANYAANRYPEVPQATHHALFWRSPEHIEASQRDLAKTFLPNRLS